MKNLVSLNPEQMKVFFLVILLEVKDINVTIKDEKIIKSIDVVVDEACKNPKQIKTEDYDNEEDEDHFLTSNHIDFEEETNEASEEEITIEEKTPSKYV